MYKIFEIKDRKGRTIHLSKERWKHIIYNHPELSNSTEKIKETIINPLTVRQSYDNEDIKFYYRYYKEKAEYLLVSVKYLNHTGFIITSLYVNSIKDER